MVAEGKKVKFNYTLTVEGKVVDTSEGREPLEYVHGEGQIIPGLAEGMQGMEPGESKKIEVAPDQGYGQVREDAYREVQKNTLPEGLEPKAGMMLQAQGPQGQVVPVTVEEVKDETVKLNFNHPLAGKTLHFDVSVVSVE
ncbi:MAG: peptidylprolyl isomerase [Candidatus Omnitrophica bacterium]|nr:peptidylprolyl isomerase [Candidatus Omnitrophota bacterium]